MPVKLFEEPLFYIIAGIWITLWGVLLSLIYIYRKQSTVSNNIIKWSTGMNPLWREGEKYFIVWPILCFVMSLPCYYKYFIYDSNDIVEKQIPKSTNIPYNDINRIAEQSGITPIWALIPGLLPFIIGMGMCIIIPLLSVNATEERYKKYWKYQTGGFSLIVFGIVLMIIMGKIFAK
jgi:hypothetical protein